MLVNVSVCDRILQKKEKRKKKRQNHQQTNNYFTNQDTTETKTSSLATRKLDNLATTTKKAFHDLSDHYCFDVHLHQHQVVSSSWSKDSSSYISRWPNKWHPHPMEPDQSIIVSIDLQERT